MKKIVSTLLCLIMLVNLIPMSVFAQSETDLETVWYDAVMDYQANLDISAYKIKYNDSNRAMLSAIAKRIFNKTFHVDSFYYTTNGTYYTKIRVEFGCTEAEYRLKCAQIETSATVMLDGIEGNSKLTEVEKALLIHDRLAVFCEYDYQNYLNDAVPDDSYTAYGAIVKGVAVCQGYAEAYTYLLERVGVNSYVTISQALDHAWNVVYIGGRKYHVDVTWDDPTWDTTGRVYHLNFLLSTNALYAGTTDYKGVAHKGHVANDYDMSPSDTRYDNYFWKDSTAEFCLLGDEIYYIDNAAAQIKRASDRKAVWDVKTKWMASATSYWRGNYSCLATDGESLFCSLDDGVYELNLTDQTSSCVHMPNLDIGDWFSLYGFTYQDGYFFCDLNNSPNFNANTKKNYQEVVYYKRSATIINTSGANIWSLPYTSGSSKLIRTAEYNSKVTVVGSTVNSYGNRWYKLSDGNWIYASHVRITDYNSRDVEYINKVFVVTSWGANIWTKPYSSGDSKIIKAEPKTAALSVIAQVRNSTGGLWYRLANGGWIYSKNVNERIFDPADVIAYKRSATVIVPGVINIWGQPSTKAPSTLTRTAAYQTKLNVVAKYTTPSGDLWYQLTDGNWVYSGNVRITDYNPADVQKVNKIVTVTSWGANVWSKPYSSGDSKVVKTVAKGANLKIDGQVRNSTYGLWYHLADGSGWIYSQNVKVK